MACPEPAREAHARADSLYGAQRFADAAVEYAKATNGCPDHAAWWVDFADSHYVLADYLCTVVGGRLRAGDDTSRVAWSTRAGLDKYILTEGTREVIERAFRARGKRT